MAAMSFVSIAYLRAAPPIRRAASRTWRSAIRSSRAGPRARARRRPESDGMVGSTARAAGFLRQRSVANPAPPAPVPACRASLPQTTVYPERHAICDPTATRSRQLMTAIAVQNYGLNSYLIKQPFDFAAGPARSSSTSMRWWSTGSAASSRSTSPKTRFRRRRSASSGTTNMARFHAAP